MKIAAALLGFAVVWTAASAAVPTDTTAKFMAACQSIKPECTNAIIAALDAGVRSGKISAKCAAGRPPKPGMALDIQLWWISHHDLDSKPLSQSAVMTAERLWPCEKVQ